MYFSPRAEGRISYGHLGRTNSCYINYVQQFKYIGHINSDGLKDDEDINREIKKHVCSYKCFITQIQDVFSKVVLFKSFCLCLYDIGLWKFYNKGTLNRFRSCYRKCLKIFFGYRRSDNVTDMLFTLNLPSFDTILHNSNQLFVHMVSHFNSNLADVLHIVMRLNSVVYTVR